jgi:hypothetical protein
MPNHGAEKKEIHMPQKDQTSNANWTIIFICWLIAAISSLGSRVLSFPGLLRIHP